MNPVRSDYFGILIKRGTDTYYYEPSDEYSEASPGFAGDYEYFGYLNTLGGYIIQRHQITTNQWRYVMSASGYATFLPFSSNLALIGALNYVLYSQMFG